MSQVVVIGAGVGGLAAAALLASQGHRVTVCEQAHEVGGKLGRWQHDGLHFDTGPSLLTLPDVLREVFDATGGWPQSLLLQRLDPLSTVRFADGTGFTHWADPVHFHDELERWSPGAGNDWDRFETHASRVWAATETAFLRNELRGARSLLALAVTHPDQLRVIQPRRTLDQLAQQYLRDPRLRQFLWRYATYTGADPRQAPAALASIPFAERRFGGWTIPGGLYEIAVALADRCRLLGVELRTSTEVTRIDARDGRIHGVELRGGALLDADVAVANADARAVYEKLLPRIGPPARVRNSLRRAPRSYSGLALLVGVRGPRDPDTPTHTVLFPPDYATEFDDLNAGRPITDPAIYVSVPDDPLVAGADAHPWFVLVNAPTQDRYDWRGTDRNACAATLLDQLAARGVDLRDRIASTEVRTPADLEDRTATPGGAIYGTASNGPRSAFLRPANRTPIRGLFLVGGSAHPGGGLPLVLLSAQLTASVIGPAGR